MMVRALLICIAAALTACASDQLAPPLLNSCNQPDHVVLRDVRLPGAKTLSEIHIRGGIIETIDSERSDQSAPNAKIIEGAGAWVLPGFIDAHTHFDTLAAGKSLYDTAAPHNEIFPATFRQALSSGVTGARVHLTSDTDLPFLQSINANPCYPAPRLTTAGPGMLAGTPGLNAPLMKGPESLTDITAQISTMHDGGAEWLALHGIARFSDEELDHIEHQASVLDLKIMVSTDDLDDLRRALTRTVHSIEYINLTEQEEYPVDIIDAIERYDGTLHWTAPIGYYRTLAQTSSESVTIADSELKFFPENFAEIMQNSIADEISSDTYVADSIKSQPTHRRKFQQLIATKLVPMISTDSGSPAQFHRDAIWREFETWYAYGSDMTNTLAAATSHPAKLLGWHQTGQIAPNYTADLILYRGDFFKGDLDRNNIIAVIKSGNVYVEDGRWIWD